MNRNRFLMIALIGLLALNSGCMHRLNPISPLRAEPRHVIERFHGIEIADGWSWIENSTDPEVMEWVEAQNESVRATLAALPQTAPFIKRLNELSHYDDELPPSEALLGTRQFIWKCRKQDEKWTLWVRDSEHDPSRPLLNPNSLAGNVSVDFAVASPDGRYLAYGLASGGSENARIRVLDVDTGLDLPDRCYGTRQGSPVWQHDSSGFFYSCNPEPGDVPAGDEVFFHRVIWHTLGTDPSNDTISFASDTEKDLYHGVDVSEDGRYIIFGRYRMDDAELFIRKNQTGAELMEIVTGFIGTSNAWVVDDTLYILTDIDAPNGQVFKADPNRPQRENWQLLIPETSDKLSSLQFIDGRIFGHYLHNAHSLICEFNPNGQVMRQLPILPLSSASVWGYWSKPPIWCQQSSFTHLPEKSIFDPVSGTLNRYHLTPVPIDTSGMETEQVWYESKDGTHVSMFLIHAKGIKPDGSHPTMLYGYGGFDVSMTPSFWSTNALWVEQGGIVAIPNIRGGGEYGRQWHLSAIRENRQRSFDDFIAAAEWLIRENWTDPKHLTISGGSNGGLLVGAVMVQRPELFRAVLCDMPLLDMLNYTQFGIADIWIPEFGNPAIEADFQFLKDYSPFHNIQPGIEYPAVLFTAAENDARVSPVHAWKMAARMQWEGKGGPFLVRTLSDQGHLGGAQISDSVRMSAEGLAFLYGIM